MKTKKIITELLVIFGLLQGSTLDIVQQASAQETVLSLTLKQSCELGVEKNVNVKNAVLEEQKAGYQLKEVQSKLFPQISAYSDFSYFYAIPKTVLPGEIFGQSGMIAVETGTKYDWNSGFKATQLLYNQSYFTSLKVAKRLEAIAELSLQQKKEEVIYQISQVYYLILTTRNQIAQLNISMQNTSRLLEIAGIQRENGVIRKVDQSRVIVNKSNLQTQIDNLEQLYLQQLGFLKQIIGIENTVEIELSDSLRFVPIPAPAALPDLTNPIEIKLLDSQIEVASLKRKLNRQSYLPTLAAFGQYSFQGQRNEFDFFKGSDRFFKVGVIGLSLTIPIFDGLEKFAKIKQNDIEIQQFLNTRKETSSQFAREFSNAERQYENSLNALRRQQESIEVAQEAYDIGLQGYQQQVVPLSDVLMSETSLTEARLSYFNALNQLKNAELEIRKAKGELLNF